MDNYNEFIELLKTFNREGRVEETEDDYLSFNEYNGFSCENLKDVSAYSKHMEEMYTKAVSDIKKGVDKLMVERDNIHMLDIFFKGKLDDFDEIYKIIEQRDDENEKDRVDYRLAVAHRYYNGVELDDLGVQLYSELARATRGEELYYRDSIDMEGLAEDCLPISERYGSSTFFHIVAEKEQRNMVKKAKQKLKELHRLYCPPNNEIDSKVEKVPTKQENDFRSYLHHDNKDALILKLHELLDGRKGKIVAITVKALEQLGFISVDSRSTIYKAMRKEFGEIGSDQSLNPIVSNYKQYSIEIEQQMKILETVK